MVGLQHRWVTVAFLLTSGYWLLFELIAITFLLGPSRWLTVPAVMATATAGSFSAARLSPLRRGLEASTGATSFFLTAVAVCVATPSDITAATERLHELDLASAVAATAAIVSGAVLGAWCGKCRLAKARRRLTTSLLSAVLVWGAVLTCVSIAALPAGLAGAKPAAPLLLGAAVTGIAAGAWVAQMLIPVRRVGSISMGAVLAFALPVLPVWGGLVIAAVGAPIVFCIAAVGARSGWSWAQWWRRRQQREADAPPTAVVVD